MKAWSRLHLASVLACAVAAASQANDAGLTRGGSPRMLSSNTTVSMDSEVIRMTVGPNTVTVDCRFVFRNTGKTTTVRVGFPDQGEGADNPDGEGEPGWRMTPPKPTFKSFRSWVNGRHVATRAIRSTTPGLYWHVKTVRFPARSRVTIRDLYTVNVGGAVGSYGGVIYTTSYVLHTGASWHGRIGRTEVLVTFKRNAMRAPLRPIALTEMNGWAYRGEDWSRDHGRVYYRGPGRPSARGMTLRWTRTSWKPVEKDDIYLAFDRTK